MRDKDDIKENVWEEFKDSKEILKFLYDVIIKKEKWVWLSNSRCKYVELRMDMRNGGFILKDRHGNRITFDELKYQYGSEEI